MRVRHRIALSILTLAAATTLAAAEKPKVRIALPASFMEAAEPLAVQKKFFGGSKPMKFGTYEVREHSRGWKKSRRSSSPVLPPYVNDPVGASASSERSTQRFSYAIYEAGESRLNCNCEIRESSRSTEVRGIPVESSGNMDLECTFIPTDDAPEWTLDVDAYGSLAQMRQTAAGSLSRMDERFSIDGVDRMSGSTFRVPAPLGFTFSGGDGTAGAVEILGPGTVMFAPSTTTEQRHAIAAAATALLLVQ